MVKPTAVELVVYLGAFKESQSPLMNEMLGKMMNLTFWMPFAAKNSHPRFSNSTIHLFILIKEKICFQILH